MDWVSLGEESGKKLPETGGDKDNAVPSQLSGFGVLGS